MEKSGWTAWAGCCSADPCAAPTRRGASLACPATCPAWPGGQARAPQVHLQPAQVHRPAFGAGQAGTFGRREGLLGEDALRIASLAAAAGPLRRAFRRPVRPAD